MKNFNAIYTEYYGSIYKTIKRAVKDEEVAKELTNDVFLRVNKKLEIYDESISKLSTWIQTIAKNILIDHFRRKTLAVSSLETLPVGDNDESENRHDNGWYKSSDFNPEQEMILAEQENSVLAIFNTLPPKQKEIADLYYFKGLSYEQIAQTLSIPMGTLKASLHSAKLAMQQAAGLLV